MQTNIFLTSFGHRDTNISKLIFTVNAQHLFCTATILSLCMVDGIGEKVKQRRWERFFIRFFYNKTTIFICQVCYSLLNSANNTYLFKTSITRTKAVKVLVPLWITRWLNSRLVLIRGFGGAGDYLINEIVLWRTVCTGGVEWYHHTSTTTSTCHTTDLRQH